MDEKCHNCGQKKRSVDKGDEDIHWIIDKEFPLGVWLAIVGVGALVVWLICHLF
jgi:hypothetical protein